MKMLAQQMISSQVLGLLETFIKKRQLSAPYCTKLISEKGQEFISYQQWWQALDELYNESKIEHLGLDIGAAAAPEFSGLLGYLGLSSLTLGDAIEQFERYQLLLFQGDQVRIERSNNKLACHWLPESGDVKRLSDETLIAGIVAFGRLLTADNKLTPLHVGFMHKAPIDLQPYRSFFGCPISFSTKTVFIEISLEHKTLQSKSSDPALGKILEQQAKFLLKQMPSDREDLVSKIKKTILNQQDWSNINQELIANALNMSSRSLHRKLTKLDIKFSQLVQQLRYQQAINYLTQDKYSIAEISHKLGYTEQSAFTRAFKKWSGKTPLGFIREQKGIDCS